MYLTYHKTENSVDILNVAEIFANKIGNFCILKIVLTLFSQMVTKCHIIGTIFELNVSRQFGEKLNMYA